MTDLGVRPLTPPAGPGWTQLPVLDLPDLPAGEVLVVSAHPDDETIGVGRLVARLAREGRAVTAHTASAGEACFVGRVPVGLGTGGDRLALGQVRLTEWRAAVQALGATPGACAGLPDGGLADLSELLEAWVVGLLSTHTPAVVVCPWRHDPHPDHEAVGEAVTRACAGRPEVVLLEHPVWTTVRWTPIDVAARGWTVAVWPSTPEDDTARERALACYPSQLTEQVPGAGPVVPADALAHHGRQLGCVRVEPR